MKEKLKGLFTETKDIEKSSYIWNAASGLLYSVRSVILLMVIMRTNGLEDAGIFSIAYAISSLMSYIGEFGVRKYQVSDIKEINSFGEYHFFRILSCAAMTIGSVGAVIYGLLYNGYSADKALIVLFVCILKMFESYADVIYGRFQQKWRLDIASKTTMFRLVASVASCCVCLIITHNLLISVIVWTVVSIITTFMSTILVAPDFCRLKSEVNKESVKRIFVECFPIFLGFFMLLYVGNAPKYAIDAYLNEVIQAKFNFIFMPVFAIEMLANFIFNPILVKLAEEWHDRHLKKFKKMIAVQMLAITGITVCAVVFAWFLGTPILSVIFGTDLSAERTELCILLIGGGMMAMVNFFAVVMTVIRQQRLLTGGYIAIALAAKLLSKFFVLNYGMLGTSLMYTSLMTGLAVIFSVTLIAGYKIELRSKKPGQSLQSR